MSSGSNAKATTAEEAPANANLDVSNAESKSDSESSSSELGGTYSKGDSWKIDLTTFSKTQTKLDTAINDSRKCGELVQAYFNKKHSALTKLPWDNKRPDYGINPMHRLLYCPAVKDEDGSMLSSPTSDLYVKLSDAGIAIMSELKDSFSPYFKNNVYNWGETKGCCIATFDQILNHPIQAFNAFRRYLATCKVKSLKKSEVRKLIKKCKRWIKANHKIWRVIVNHLDVDSTDICGGIELSNGLVLLRTMKSKFGHTHAQCLAQLLRELTNVALRKTKTGKVESIQKYMDRVQRIARTAGSFPAMTVPIALPLIKVFALEGLLKSNPKYSNMVTLAYSNDLADSMERLTAQMQTVEGVRGKQIHDEFGSTNLHTATVAHGKGVRDKDDAGYKPGNGPDDPCNIRGHSRHTNSQCSVKKLRKLRQEGRAAPPQFTSEGKRVCDFFANNIRCPFRGCRFPHTRGKSKPARANRAATTESSSSSSDERRARRHRKSKKKNKSHKHGHKSRHRSKKHKKKYSRSYYTHETSDSSSSSTESSSDFP